LALTSKKYFLNRNKMPAFLDNLEESAGTVSVSLYIPPGLSVPEIEGSVDTAGVQSIPDEVIELIAASKNGAAVFRGDLCKYLIVPSFPFKEKVIFSDCNTVPLRLLLDSVFKIGLVLVHLGSYAVGFCRGDKLVSSKVGTGLIHGRHKKGGSSQQRFQRRRQNQAEEFLDRVCSHAAEHLEPQARELDYIVYGGPRQTVLQLKKRCPFLQSLEERELPLLEVPALRQAVLEKTVSRVWSSQVIEWREE